MSLMNEVATPQPKNIIVEGDCNVILHPNARDKKTQIPFDKFDVVIMDPPYNIGKDFGAGGNDKMDLDEYKLFMEGIIQTCRQLLNENGIIFIYGFPEILCHVASLFKPEEQRWLTWHYRNMVVPSSKWYQRSFQSILCIWEKGKKRPDIDIDGSRIAYHWSMVKRKPNFTQGQKCRFGNKSVMIGHAHPKGRLAMDTIEYPIVNGGVSQNENPYHCDTCDCLFTWKDVKKHKDCSYWRHPTVKPMDLTRYLIKSMLGSSSYRRNILIPFSGSGSESIVAREMNHNSFAIDLNPQYVKYGNMRLAETYVANTLIWE